LETVPSREFATQIELNAGRTVVGPLPTGARVVTWSDRGSMRLSVPAPEEETHTPSDVYATPVGRAASGTVVVFPDATTIRTSTLAALSATQSEPSPTAIPEGPEPTGSSCVTLFVSGLIRETVPSPAFVTHTEPSPTATPAGDSPTWIVSLTWPFVRS
jgi:hypothetical protein